MASTYTTFLRGPESGQRRSSILDAEGRAQISGRLVRTVQGREFGYIKLKVPGGWTGIVYDPDYSGLTAVVAIVGAWTETEAWAAARAEVNRVIGGDGDEMLVEPPFDTFIRNTENGNRRTGVLDARNETAQLSGKLIALDDGREIVQIKLWAANGWTEFLLDPEYTGVSSLITVTGGWRESDAWKPAAAELQRIVDAGY
jgi:hypothetical protein